MVSCGQEQDPGPGLHSVPIRCPVKHLGPATQPAHSWSGAWWTLIRTQSTGLLPFCVASAHIKRAYTNLLWTAGLPSCSHQFSQVKGCSLLPEVKEFKNFSVPVPWRKISISQAKGLIKAGQQGVGAADSEKATRELRVPFCRGAAYRAPQIQQPWRRCLCSLFPNGNTWIRAFRSSPAGGLAACA